MRGSHDLSNIFHTLKFKRKFKREHPDYFVPDGLIVFTGSQGSGKTLSAVQYIINLCLSYPKAILCTNVDIDYPLPNQIEIFDGVSKFKSLNNGEYGVIYFIDEIQLLFNSLESKGLDVNLFETICQQRKQRKHIVGTSQIFGRLAKGFREQFKYVVSCRQLFGLIQWNRYALGDDCISGEDGHFKVTKSHLLFYFLHPDMFSCYDTTAVIDRQSFNFKWEF